jgi:hypothetical protein
MTRKPSKGCNHKPNYTGPTSYLEWHEWAEKRIKAGWQQRKCKKCQLYVEWIKPVKSIRTSGRGR